MFILILYRWQEVNQKEEEASLEKGKQRLLVGKAPIVQVLPDSAEWRFLMYGLGGGMEYQCYNLSSSFTLEDEECGLGMNGKEHHQE